MADNRTVFKKIIDGDVPAKLIYEDEHCLAFRDIDPRAPTHILVIPRKEIRSLAEVEEQDAALLGHLM
ncbi:MAG: HIT domain-containing protein, partial [Planctomycetota bacterium]